TNNDDTNNDDTNNDDTNNDDTNNDDANNDDANNDDTNNDDANNDANNDNTNNDNNANDIIENFESVYVHGVTLYPGESSINMYEDGFYDIAYFILNDDFETQMEISANASNLEIENELNLQLEGTGYISELSKTSNAIYFYIVSTSTGLTEEHEIVGEYPDYYSDYAADFFNYQTGNYMTAADFNNIPNAIALYLWGNNTDGGYYHFPFEILAIEGSDYSPVDAYTVLVGPDYWGEIILDGDFL
ncbi:MAG: hypothetical protein PF505_03370, partial [Vallitaleaceae bacterium]|nr:hypothetical protein [Vallitaleaceae bacterium]